MYAINIEWFEQVVGAVFTNFLRSQPIPKEAPNRQLLNRIAQAETVISIFPKKGTKIRPGHVVKFSDIKTV